MFIYIHLRSTRGHHRRPSLPQRPREPPQPLLLIPGRRQADAPPQKNVSLVPDHGGAPAGLALGGSDLLKGAQSAQAG